jgi:RNA polymerase sigma factor (sigma-70 family)
VSGDATSQNDEQDQRLLRRLASIGDRDPLAARRLQAELLAPYFNFAREVAAYRLYRLRLNDGDLDDIANRVLKRLADAIAKGHLGKPLRNVAYDNIDWEIKDFFKRRRKTRPEEPRDPAELPQPNEVDDKAVSLLEEAEAFRVRVAGLPERQRRIVTERLFFGRKPGQIAADLGMKRGALDTDYSRALASLRGSDAMADVRDRLSASEGPA